MRRPCPAFTLIEILVVLGIIDLLLALLLPAVSRVRQQARVTQCANRLHQVGLALQAHQTARGSLPTDGTNGYGYGVYLLPQLEQANLFEKVDPHGASFSAAGAGQLDAGAQTILNSPVVDYSPRSKVPCGRQHIGARLCRPRRPKSA